MQSRRLIGSWIETSSHILSSPNFVKPLNANDIIEFDVDVENFNW